MTNRLREKKYEFLLTVKHTDADDPNPSSLMVWYSIVKKYNEKELGSHIENLMLATSNNEENKDIKVYIKFDDSLAPVDRGYFKLPGSIGNNALMEYGYVCESSSYTNC